VIRRLAALSSAKLDTAFPPAIYTAARNAGNEMVRMTPQLGTGEVLAGLVERVTYHNAARSVWVNCGLTFLRFDASIKVHYGSPYDLRK